MKKLKILIVDDKKVIGDLFELTIAKDGHEVIWEKNIEPVLKIINKDTDIDIVFLDIIMPEEDGVSVLKKIKEISPDMPVVMMSGYSVEEKRYQSMILGADALLKKPFDIEDIKKVIKDVLGEEI